MAHSFPVKFESSIQSTVLVFKMVDPSGTKPKTTDLQSSPRHYLQNLHLAFPLNPIHTIILELVDLKRIHEILLELLSPHLLLDVLSPVHKQIRSGAHDPVELRHRKVKRILHLEFRVGYDPWFET